MKKSKILTFIMVCVMAIASVFSFAGCQGKLAMGKEMVKYKTQFDSIVALNNDSVDAIVIDSIMAGYYSVEGSYAGKISIVPNLVLAEEEYGIAGRKGDVSFMSKINEALIALNDLGTMETIANNFGVNDSLTINSSTTNPLTSATDNSWEKIKSSKKIVIGYTVFAPIAYDINGVLTGFDIELARAAVAYLNTVYNTEIDLEFVIIDWNAKEALLENETIDLIWNGMTITEEREEAMCISVPYLANRQVAVVKKENVANYTDKASFENAVIGVEKGSAGMSVVKGK